MAICKDVIPDAIIVQAASKLLADSVRRAVTKAAIIALLAQAAPVGPAVTPHRAGLLNLAGLENGGAVAADLDGRR